MFNQLYLKQDRKNGLSPKVQFAQRTKYPLKPFTINTLQNKYELKAFILNTLPAFHPGGGQQPLT
jgi:hypothetical protein